MKQTKDTSVSSINAEIEQTLSNAEIDFESIPDETSSPLNQPVVEKTHHQQSHQKQEDSNDPGEDSSQNEESDKFNTDAPEQEINYTGNGSTPSEEDLVEIPLAHATLAADTFLGIADNALEVGGGFFITIRKHEDFYDFEEVVQVIDEQNGKNVSRFKLDAEDKALLRPLLIVVIRKKAKILTPEQQLAAAALSILVKKAKLAVEIRSENNMLVERIRNIIHEAKGTEDNASESRASGTATPPNPGFPSVLEVAE